MKVVDARGYGCPKPVVMAEEALNTIEEGTVEVIVDNEASVSNLARFARKNGMHVETVRKEGFWSLKITKGYVCEAPPGDRKAAEETAQVQEGGRQGTLMIIGSDILGREEEIGRILMKGFLETLRVTRDLPDMIFFLNAGVRLTTINEETVPVIREIESLGVDIFSCGTCLKHYNLEPELKVGYRGTTNHIVEGIKDFGKVIWI